MKKQPLLFKPRLYGKHKKLRRKPGRRGRRGGPKKKLVKSLCDNIANGGSITSSCEAVGISVKTYYRWKTRARDDAVLRESRGGTVPSRYEKFLMQIEKALSSYKSKLQKVVRRTAIEGKKKTQYDYIYDDEGNLVEERPSSVTFYQDGKLALHILSVLEPETWGKKNNVEVTHSGTVDHTLDHTIHVVSPAQMDGIPLALRKQALKEVRDSGSVSKNTALQISAYLDDVDDYEPGYRHVDDYTTDDYADRESATQGFAILRQIM